MPLLGIDHLELWVGNAAQAAYFLTHAFGFNEVAYSGLETGLRDRTSHVLEQGRIRLVRHRRAAHADHPIAEHHRRHGDGVKVVALRPGRRGRLPRGAGPRREAARARRRSRTTTATSGSPTSLPMATPSTASSTGPATTARSCPATARSSTSAATALHAASTTSSANVGLGAMDRWVKFYEDVFGMTEMIHFSDEAISTEYSALMSKVVTDGNGRVKFPINEPAEGKRKSQIDEYLDYYEGPGVQHIALSTTRHRRDRRASCRRAASGSCGRLTAYYEDVPERIGEIDESLDDLRRLGILVDRDDEGYLLQIFTKPVGDRPTCSSRSSSATARAASGRATSRPSSRRSSASRPRGGTSDALRVDGPRAGQAPHPVPRERALLIEEVMGYEGFSGNESILYHLHSPCRVAEVGDVRADRARGVGARRARPPADRHGRRWSRRATPSSAAGS